MLEQFPDHVLVDLINQFLDGSNEALCRSSLVCRSWQKALTETQFWRQRLVARFGDDGSLYHPDYRERFESASTTDSENEGVAHPKMVYGATHSLEKRFSNGLFVSRGRFYHSAPITSILADEVGGKFFISDSNGQVFVSSKNGEYDSVEFDGFCTLPSPASCLGVIKGWGLCAGHVDGSVSLFANLHSKFACHEGRVSGIVHQCDNRIFTVSTKDLSLKLTDLDRAAIVHERRLNPEAAPNAVATLGEHVSIVGSRDDKCRLYDVRQSGLPVNTIELSDWCLCVEASEQTPFLLRASDKAVHTFDLRNPSYPIESRHQSRRLIAKFKSDAALRLVSCGLDGELRVSSLETADSPVASLYCADDYVLATDFDRTTLCCGGMNGKFELFSFNASNTNST